METLNSFLISSTRRDVNQMLNSAGYEVFYADTMTREEALYCFELAPATNVQANSWEDLRSYYLEPLYKGKAWPSEHPFACLNTDQRENALQATQYFEAHNDEIADVKADLVELRQTTTHGITRGNVLTLLRRLENLGIGKKDINSLKRAVSSYQNEKAALEGWLGKLAVERLASDMRSFELVVTAVTQYLGV